MKKQLAILLLTASCATAAPGQLRWSASGIVGRDGRPWNGEVSLYSVPSGETYGERLRQTVVATNGQAGGSANGGGYEVSMLPFTYFYRVVDGGKTFQSTPASQTTYFDPPELEEMVTEPNILELNFFDMPYMSYFQGWLMTYGEWAGEHGIEGAWDEKDAHGVANVFRYLFDAPDGVPSLGIRVNEAGRVVVTTPPLVYTAGFLFLLVAADYPDFEDWGHVQALLPPAEDGENLIEEQTDGPRFYCLKAQPVE